jgi:6-phosphogluconolactonase
MTCWLRFLGILTVLLSATPAFANDVLYISVAGDKRIALYRINPADGKLAHVADTATTGEPGALATDPKGRLLFAAFRSTGELAAFRIDATTGKLTHINTVPAGADPAHISVDKEVKYLLTAYYVAGQVTVHAIADDGSLSKAAHQTVKTQDKAHAVVFTPWHSAVLVPHTGPNVIYTYYWLGQSGRLEKPSLGRASFATPAGTGPRHVVFHPTLLIMGGVDCTAEVAYVANEQGGSVTMYHAILNPLNWFLNAKQTLSTLPADFKGTNACAEIRLHPSSRFLYVSNRGHDSIAGFRVDQSTGRLTSLGQTATEKTPRSFDIEPSGKYLYAAGESSNRLAAYRVDEKQGSLTRMTTYDVGRMPWWVMAMRLPTSR